jgi:hypothetical protein
MSDFLRSVRALAKSANPDMELIQGETGTQSRRSFAGALSGAAWTERRQAKYLARHFMADFREDVKFASYFSSLDMAEALNGTKGDTNSYKDFGYFGVLRAEFDENGKATGIYTPKPSYRTLQVVASVFREEFKVEEIPVAVFMSGERSVSILRNDDTMHDVTRVCFTRPNGSCAMAYWRSAELLTTEYEGTVAFQSTKLPGPCRLIDLYDGSIYEIPESIMEQKENCILFKNMPLRDYPLLLTFGDFC